VVKQKKPDVIRLDLGCGKNKKPDFLGVDSIAFEGVDVVADLRKKWPWKDGTVEEVNASHFVEHLTAPERIHFANELHRVLRKGCKATIITPHWASCRAYGDMTHQWPPVSEFWFYYLLVSWREVNAPHNQDYTCDFDAAWGYSPHPSLSGRNQEYQQFALTNYKEAAMDMMATLTKR
jgi:hypothetical protein